MGAVIPFLDGLRNLVANLGTARDKAAGSFYAEPLITEQELLAAYRGAWLPRKIVDIPALDACRKWRVWQASKEQITAIEAEERRHNLRQKALQALTAARLYGGAALYIGTDDSDPMEPLNPERIGRGGLRYITVMTPRQVAPGQVDLDPASEWYGRPQSWMLTDAMGGGLNVHPSRLAIFVGAARPEGDPMAQRGWGDSVLLSCMEAIKQADGTAANVASLVYEAKVDVIRVPNLMRDIGGADYERRLQSRFTLAATMKGINGALLMDKEEDYDQKSGSFSTLPDIMDRFFQNVSGAADIPVTRLFGRSPAGLNSTGDADLRNYYDRIQAIQQLEMQPAMWRLDEAVIRSALGVRPPEVYFEWASLWQVSERERADIGKVAAETIKQLRDADVFPVEVLMQAGGNALVETGALPGLDAALAEFGYGDGSRDEEIRAAFAAQGEDPET